MELRYLQSLHLSAEEETIGVLDYFSRLPNLKALDIFAKTDHWQHLPSLLRRTRPPLRHLNLHTNGGGLNTNSPDIFSDSVLFSTLELCLDLQSLELVTVSFTGSTFDMFVRRGRESGDAGIICPHLLDIRLFSCRGLQLLRTAEMVALRWATIRRFCANNIAQNYIFLRCCDLEDLPKIEVTKKCIEEGLNLKVYS
ncbi:hypothetical protein DFH11DRAFT_422547 [Phellopilus nigrolimitatus]|nr:hypothetical protein DFH11DRAFT_422547 [Phellopilus nigrolimitatus]